MTRLSALMAAVRDARWIEMRDVAEAQRALLRAQAMRWIRPLGELVDVATQPASPRLAASPAEREMGERFARAIDRATRYGIFRARCLARAVALSQMLDANGIRGHRIRIGVQRSRGTFTAHAWVELGELVLGDSVSITRSYVPLTEAYVVSGGPHSGMNRIPALSGPRLPDGQSLWDQ